MEKTVILKEESIACFLGPAWTVWRTVIATETTKGDEEDTHGDGDNEELDPPTPLVRVTVIWTLPRVSPTLVQPRYKVW